MPDKPYEQDLRYSPPVELGYARVSTAQLAVVLLALFGQMERTYTLKRAAHARARQRVRQTGPGC